MGELQVLKVWKRSSKETGKTGETTNLHDIITNEETINDYDFSDKMPRATALKTAF
jgi:hypothetical protein